MIARICYIVCRMKVQIDSKIMILFCSCLYVVMRLKCQCEIRRPNGTKDKLTEALEIGKSALPIAQSFLPSESFEIFYCTLIDC